MVAEGAQGAGAAAEEAEDGDVLDAGASGILEDIARIDAPACDDKQGVWDGGEGGRRRHGGRGYS